MVRVLGGEVDGERQTEVQDYRCNGYIPFPSYITFSAIAPTSGNPYSANSSQILKIINTRLTA